MSSDVGVIDGTMTMSAPTLEKILQAVNEKYGTSFEGWSQLPTAYEVGDTVPNWNAYEKILLPAKIFVAASLGNNGYSIGYIMQNKYVFYAENDQNTYVMSMQGNVIAKNVPIETSWNYRVKPELENNGYENVTEYLTETKIFEVGDNVENIGEYQFIE